MSKSAKSVLVFSIYVFVLGLILITIPNVLLSVFGLPKTNEVWIRVVGVLVLFLGYYYFQVSRNELKIFFRWSVYARTGLFLFFIGFVLFDLAPPILILFGFADVAGALWTYLSLRSEKQK
ncbi:MAG: hypothetical protein DRI95_03990 [Bacteroidetes bacterium]|nr:MAG: hypothetical protein DRI95_03990 [Bacteroidota bacterium]